MEYFAEVSRVLEQVVRTQEKAVEKAAGAVAQALLGDGMIYTFGTGHSHMLAEELFYRAGGLVRVYPIMDDPLMLHINASRSSKMERLPGYAQTLLEDGPNPKEGDVLFIFSNSGRNAVPLEMAVEAKKRGVTTVCITNLTHSGQVTSRHTSGKRLYELCDIVIDNCGCVGDAAIRVGDQVCGPTSTAIGAAILQAIVCSTVEEMLRRGASPEVFCSSNVDGGDAINQVYIDKYRKEIPML
jgi:uncharacterized phosphosugar-binding protein